MSGTFNPYRDFNPMKGGKVRKSGSRSVSASERVWNDQGVFNASSRKELVETIAGLLDGFQSGEYDTGSIEKSAADFGDQEGIIREAFSDPSNEGFTVLGQQMVNVIKEVIDYEGVARKVMLPRSVKTGEVVRYDRDAFVLAWQIAADGQTPVSVVEGRYFYPPEFEISAYPNISYADMHRAQYDIIARIQGRAKESILYREDAVLMNLLLAGGNSVNATTFFAALNVAALESMRYQIERHRLLCDKFIINRQEASDFITTVSAQVDPVTQRELFMAGYIGSFLNAQIVTTAGTNTYEILQPGQVVAVTKPENLGGMPIRIELQSEPTQPAVDGAPRKGWFFWELLGFALSNPAGVALGSRL